MAIGSDELGVGDWELGVRTDGMDLYVVLGLPHGASESDIKRAYRRLARRFHPDINPGDRIAEARFRQILEAYETLIDPDRRSRYDSGDPADSATQRRASGFEGFDFSAYAEERLESCRRRLAAADLGRVNADA